MKYNFKTDNSADLPKNTNSINLEQSIIDLYTNNQALKEKIEELEIMMAK